MRSYYKRKSTGRLQRVRGFRHSRKNRGRIEYQLRTAKRHHRSNHWSVTPRVEGSGQRPERNDYDPVDMIRLFTVDPRFFM